MDAHGGKLSLWTIVAVMVVAVDNRCGGPWMTVAVDGRGGGLRWMTVTVIGIAADHHCSDGCRKNGYRGCVRTYGHNNS